jgi:gliding motility-associated-like protein
MKKLTITSMLLVLLLIKLQAQACFTPIWTGNGLDHMNFYITTATVNGVDMQPGDEIGVFDGDDCVGTSVLTEVLTGSNILSIKASKDDPDTPAKDGFTVDNSVSFRLCIDGGTTVVTDVTATYSAGTGTFSASGTAMASLSGVTACVNPPTLTLSSASGSTCVNAPITISGNTFGGSATSVTITENGAGTVSPASASASPFDFTYTPATGDAGNTVTITVTTDNPLGYPCEASTATYTLTVNPLPAAAGAITGTATVCQGASAVAYNVPAIANATSYAWAYSGTGATITGTTNSVTISFATNATSGNLTVYGVNSCGNGAVSANYAITVNPLPAAAGAITGSPAVCQGASSVVYSVAAITNATSYVWAYSGTGATITGTTNSVTISFATNATSGNLTVRGVNSCGNGAVSTNYAITVDPLPAAAGTITGSPAVCQGASSVVYSVAAITNATSYVWAYSGTGATITGTTNSVTISFATNATSGNLTVRGVNSCGNGAVSANYAITVNPLPVVDAGTDQTIPAGTSTVLNATVSGTGPFTYSWAPSARLIDFSVEDPTTKNLSQATTFTLTATSTTTGCSNSDNVTVNITGDVLSANPTANPQTVCKGSSVQLNAGAAGGSGTYSYSWTSDPAGFTSNLANPTASPTVNTTYYVEVNDGYSIVNAQVTVTVVSVAAPVVGAITHPTCTVATGSVVLSGLPAGNWTINPGAITGSTTSTTVTGLVTGTYNFTVTNSIGCVSPPSANVIINEQPETPTAPVIGTITQPTCTVSSGSVVLTGLPETGTWIVTRSPGGITATGTGTSTTITDILAGTYTFTVTNAEGCVSPASVAVTIFTQPVTPTPPLVGLITQPVCGVPTGSVVLGGLPSTGIWTLTRYPGAITSTGSGVSSTITGLQPGTYNYTVTNASGCTSSLSASIVINDAPVVPGIPIVGTITQPTCTVATGSVVLSNLPSTGEWVLTRAPDAVTTNGTGTTVTIAGLSAGTYNYTVTNSDGCTSAASSNFTINTQPATPTPPIVGTVTQPTCAVATGSVGLSGLPSTGTWTLTRFPGNVPLTGTGASGTITGIPPGTYTYTVTNAAGCTSASSASFTINEQPVTPTAPVISEVTQPSCAVATGSILISGLPDTGEWTLTRNPGAISFSGTGTTTTVSGLDPGTYSFTVRNADGCTSASSILVSINTQPLTPTAPVIGTITHPTCTVATGSVVLTGLPSSGTWMLTRYPGLVSFTGSGVNTTITGLPSGSYNYTVTNSSGCTSVASATIDINPQPPTPSVPVHTVDCSLGFGNAIITVTSPVGTGYEYRLDAGGYQTGTIFTNVANGTHYITVRNTSGCTATGTSFSVNCGCTNPPIVSLSAYSGSICGTTEVTVSNNTFSGSATSVTITENGGGSVSPISSTTSPFSFTYTPSPADAGRVVTIKVTTDNPLGSPCAAASVNYDLTVNAIPPAPSVGTIIHPTCTVATGSVVLNGLPAYGEWTLKRLPDNVIITGSGTSTTVTGLLPGTYSFIVTNSLGCISSASSNVIINTQPATPTPPVIGTITHPTCAVSTGSVALSGLPSSGSWILTLLPGNQTLYGSGTTKTVTGIVAGTYTFTVTNASGCVSAQSEQMVINKQPVTPTAPLIGTVTHPTCTVSTGSVVLNGLPETGQWTLIRYPGGSTSTGTGTNTTVDSLASGTYNFVVRNEAGCNSLASSNVIINTQPPTPTPPVVGTITQPNVSEPTGSVVLTGLPSSGTWTLIRYPDGVSQAGTGTYKVVTNLEPGTYTFTVTNAVGCTSAESDEVVINPRPGPPKLVINDPAKICSNQTVDLTLPAITEGSDEDLTYTYWIDAGITEPLETPEAAEPGTYYIKGTTDDGYFTVKPVAVDADQMPEAYAGPDQLLEYLFGTTLNADIPEAGTGLWSVVEGTGELFNSAAATTAVDDLSIGDNVFRWTVTNGVCPSISDDVVVTVHDLIVPTLITPNGDGRNDYFILRGIETLGKTELIIFDRRGTKVYENDDYDNTWEGLDYNGHPLPDDTYFYVFRSANGRALSGYIVVRR